MTQALLARPVREGHRRDELGPRPVRRRRHVGERGEGRRRLLEAVEAPPQVTQRRVGEAGADPTDVDQPPILVRTEQEGAKPRARARRVGEAADDELAARPAARLPPVGVPAFAVRRISPLGHDPLELVVARLAEERRAATHDVVAVSQRVTVGAPHERSEALLALLERKGPQIGAIQMEEVEHHVAQPVAALAAQRRLQGLEARPPIAVEDHDLAVEPRGDERERRAGARHRPEALGPVLSAAHEQARAAVLDPAERAVAVVLDLVQPVVPRRRLVGEDRELRAQLVPAADRA